MNIKKIVLYFFVALLGTLIWIAWQKDYPAPTNLDSKGLSSQRTTKALEDFTPPDYQSDHTQNTAKPITKSKSDFVDSKEGEKQLSVEGYIEITTDVLKVSLSTLGGNAVSAKLLAYPVSVKEKDIPVEILTDSPDQFYVAQGGVTNSGEKNTYFKSEKKQYKLLPNEKSLVVLLTGKTQSGLLITKKYTLTRGRYTIQEEISITNQSHQIWKGSFYNQFIRKNVAPSQLFSRSYTGAAISTHENLYEKLPFKKLSEQNLNKNIEGGWVAIQTPYFLSAWVPHSQIENHYYSQSFGEGSRGKGNTFILGYVSPVISLFPGTTVSNYSLLYVGPELEDQLSTTAKGLDLTINYGWLWFLSKPIFWVMSHIHSIVGNWGWSIILVTLLIKLIFYPLSAKSYKSMAKMRELTPRLQALRERYADDKQALGRATMEFYKKEKVSPAGGCLPMLIQVPVFIALYYVLIESVQLRQAPFVFWIHDLSVKDPFYVLPVLMGVSMLLQQKMSPPPPDPAQAKMMMILPIVFTIFFLSFPAGLVLYWLTNNCLSIAQQWYIMKSYHANPKKKKTIKNKK